MNIIYFFYLFTFFRIAGMHRKSLEAAEALKNDDSCNSDREDTQSKSSDISCTGNNNNTSNNNNNNSINNTSKSVGQREHPHKDLMLNNDAIISSRHSVTPTSSGPPSHLTASSPISVTTTSTPSTPPALTGGVPDGKSLMSSPTHAPYLHGDQDQEAFRWVDYNRDPISFIRCAFIFIFLFNHLIFGICLFLFVLRTFAI